MKIFSNSVYTLSLTEENKIITFQWEDANKDMSYEDFQEACSNYLGWAFEHQAKLFLIDVRNFQFQLPPTFPTWQTEEHYPRYFKLGVQKVAYVMPEQALAHAKEIPAEKGKFELKNFGNREEAVEWLMD